jgi:hypothetical protein
MALSPRVTLIRGAAGTLVLVALVALLASAATVPHAHASTAPALFNEEHDLTAFATVGGSAGLVPDAPRLSPLVVSSVLGVGLTDSAPTAAPRRVADPRAPPVR